MESYFFFAIALLAIFSILENLKGRGKIGLVKAQLLVLLLVVAINSILLYINELNIVNLRQYNIVLHMSIIIFMYNTIYLSITKKLTWVMVFVECIFALLYIDIIFDGFGFIDVDNLSFKKPSNSQIYFNILIRIIGLFIIIRSLIINNKNYTFKEFYKTIVSNQKVNIALFVIVFFMPIIVQSLILFGFNPEYNFIVIAIYIGIISFSLYRPDFFDSHDTATYQIYENDSETKKFVSIIELEFYTNKYYLNPNVKIETFIDKVGLSKFEILEFVKLQKQTSFSDLINKARIDYLIELLNDKRYKAYTIEALSSMSGFSNRRTMYLYFKKFYNSNPTEHMNNPTD